MVRGWPGLKKSIPFLIETSSDILSSLVTIRKEWNKSLFPLLYIRYLLPESPPPPKKKKKKKKKNRGLLKFRICCYQFKFSVGDLSYSESAFSLQTSISNWTWIKSSLKFPQDINPRPGKAREHLDLMQWRISKKVQGVTHYVQSIYKVAIEWWNYEVFSKLRWRFFVNSMAIWVVEFSNGGYKIRKIFA